MYLVIGIKYKGLWVYGKCDGIGEFVYFNYRYMGNFLDDNFQGVGKYWFDIGCE